MTDGRLARPDRRRAVGDDRVAPRADPDSSYTAMLLSGHEDKLLKKIAEESGEVMMAAKDAVPIICAMRRPTDLPPSGGDGALWSHPRRPGRRARARDSSRPRPVDPTEPVAPQG